MLNSFSGIGRLGADPQIRKNGEKVSATFNIAINEFYKQDNDLRKKTHWIPCVSFGRLAEIAGEFLTKGSLVGVRGPLKYGEWLDDSGNKQRRIEVQIVEFEFLSSRPDEREQSTERDESAA